MTKREEIEALAKRVAALEDALAFERGRVKALEGLALKTAERVRKLEKDAEGAGEAPPPNKGKRPMVWRDLRQAVADQDLARVNEILQNATSWPLMWADSRAPVKRAVDELNWIWKSLECELGL